MPLLPGAIAHAKHVRTHAPEIRGTAVLCRQRVVQLGDCSSGQPAVLHKRDDGGAGGGFAASLALFALLYKMQKHRQAAVSVTGHATVCTAGIRARLGGGPVAHRTMLNRSRRSSCESWPLR